MVVALCLVLALVLTGAISVDGNAQVPQPRTASQSASDTWSTVVRLEGSHNGAASFRLAVEADGVMLNAARDAIAGLRPGGSLTITEERFSGFPDPDPLRPVGSTAPIVRTIRVTRTNDSGVHYAYSVNGESREFGEEGRAWLARILREQRTR